MDVFVLGGGANAKLHKGKLLFLHSYDCISSEVPGGWIHCTICATILFFHFLNIISIDTHNIHGVLFRRNLHSLTSGASDWAGLAELLRWFTSASDVTALIAYSWRRRPHVWWRHRTNAVHCMDKSVSMRPEPLPYFWGKTWHAKSEYILWNSFGACVRSVQCKVFPRWDDEKDSGRWGQSTCWDVICSGWKRNEPTWTK